MFLLAIRDHPELSFAAIRPKNIQRCRRAGFTTKTTHCSGVAPVDLLYEIRKLVSDSEPKIPFYGTTIAQQNVWGKAWMNRGLRSRKSSFALRSPSAQTNPRTELCESSDTQFRRGRMA
jgi:hypothetical protein